MLVYLKKKLVCFLLKLTFWRKLFRETIRSIRLEDEKNNLSFLFRKHLMQGRMGGGLGGVDS